MRLPLLLLTLVVAACGDDGASAGYIRAEVNGGAWQRAATDGEVVYAVEPPTASIFSIATRKITGGAEFLSLNLPYPAAVGSYALGGDTATASFAACPDQDLGDCAFWRPVSAHPGTLAITSIDSSDGTIRGTFSFDGYLLGDSTKPHIPIQNGRFAIRLQE